MYRIISSRASHVVSDIRTLHPTPNRTSKLEDQVSLASHARPTTPNFIVQHQGKSQLHSIYIHN
jgi:hypothetical protein